MALELSGGRLFVAYADGAAVIEIGDTDCADYLDRHACPGCDTPDCIVLATVLGWRPGRRLEDPADPQSDPLADAAAGIARIDNDLGRVDRAERRRSRESDCLHPRPGRGWRPGAAGTARTRAGPPRAAGGTGAAHQDLPARPAAPGPPGPQGPQGDPGVGLDPDYCHICAISWQHGGEVEARPPQGDNFPGLLGPLVIAFDNPVRNGDLHRNSVVLELSRDSEPGARCWCEPSEVLHRQAAICQIRLRFRSSDVATRANVPGSDG